MLNKNNPTIKTLSSLNFALFIISAIAITSIAGTIIPQGESIQFYAQRFGSKPAVILELLNITNMYSSYWFLGLLILFSDYPSFSASFKSRDGRGFVLTANFIK